MSIVNTAIRIALESHQGDRNKHDGELYLLHVQRVASRIHAKGSGVTAEAVAWLHDVVEDTPTTLDDVYLAFVLTAGPGTAAVIRDAVDAITKRDGETNRDYYFRVRENPTALIVKRDGDMPDNFGRNHEIADEKTRLRMATKYSLGMSILDAAP